MSLKLKLLLITIVPMIAIAIGIGAATYYQALVLIDSETAAVEKRILDAKKQEIRNYISLALTSIEQTYTDEPGGREAAQEEVKKILHNMTFGEDGYFFVYKLDGTNLVHPKLAHLVGEVWWDLQDPEGAFVIRDLIETAKKGGGFHSYVWHKPSTDLVEDKLGYAIRLEKWGWMLGTGLYLDDIAREVSAIREDFSVSIRETIFVIFIVTLGAIIIAGTLIGSVRFSEQRFADTKLKQLTTRVFEVQEQERKRVSTDLHDGISQLLVSVRYGLEMMESEAHTSPELQGQAGKCLNILDRAIMEVRRISRDLRPSVLDDMGLAAALKSLGQEFQTQSGITVSVTADRAHNRLSDRAKTALYRVVQECLTNVARHSKATAVDIELLVTPKLLTLRVEDNGIGFPQFPPKCGGLGFRNIYERMEAYGGTVRLSSAGEGGAKIEISLPLARNQSVTPAG